MYGFLFVYVECPSKRSYFFIEKLFDIQNIVATFVTCQVNKANIISTIVGRHTDELNNMCTEIPEDAKRALEVEINAMRGLIERVNNMILAN